MFFSHLSTVFFLNNSLYGQHFESKQPKTSFFVLCTSSRINLSCGSPFVSEVNQCVCLKIKSHRGMDDDGLESESTPQLETEIISSEHGEGSIQDPCDVMEKLWDEITFAERLQLEAEIRATKQGGRSIKELFCFMDGMWYQMEPKDLMESSIFRKFLHENYLVQFLLALRDEFEPFKRSLLRRDVVPSLKEVISELKSEEARLKSSSGYLKDETETEENDEPESLLLSPLSTIPEENDEPTHSGSAAGDCNAAESVAASPAIAQVPHRFGGSEEPPSGEGSGTIKILTYNVCLWDVEQHERMKAICGLIQLHTPDIICFQEVTIDSYNIFKQSSWWKAYQCSVSPEETGRHSHFCIQLCRLPVKSFSMWPFRNSGMGRELCMADIQVCGKGKSLIVATSHLESPDPFRQMYSKERVVQAKKSIKCLNSFQNVIFCGDMNWTDEREGPFPLAEGWIDAWKKLRPWLKGWTCDTHSNPMLIANRPLQLRSDRFLCKLNDFKLVKISMIGTEAIPGVSYLKEKRFGGRMQTLKLPVLPSDHYGLLLEIQSN